MRIVMVDWSGRKARADRAIALAEVYDGRLLRVEKGRDRRQILDELLSIIRSSEDIFIGLDFAFSLPAWFLEERDWTVNDLWAVDTEEWLESCPAPFWGRPGVRRPDGDEDYHFRLTDQAISIRGIRPKSVFQIGGAGSVGSGSLRVWVLPELQATGAAIWPFERPSYRRRGLSPCLRARKQGPLTEASAFAVGLCNALLQSSRRW